MNRYKMLMWEENGKAFGKKSLAFRWKCFAGFRVWFIAIRKTVGIRNTCVLIRKLRLG